MSEVAFQNYPKIPRFHREVIVTEKIDGTNVVIHIDGDITVDPNTYVRTGTLRAGSRNRWITPSDDNFGFAKWVAEHSNELILLGDDSIAKGAGT